MKDLINTSNLEKVATIVYSGRGVSLNKFYSQGHWSTRSNIKNTYRKVFTELLDNNKDIRWVDKYFLAIYYNSAHDPDNVIGMEKVFTDTLKQEKDKAGNIIYKGYIQDDSKKYCRGVSIFPDEQLPKNTFKFVLYEYGN
jgi:hypothetical protein